MRVHGLAALPLMNPTLTVFAFSGSFLFLPGALGGDKFSERRRLSTRRSKCELFFCVHCAVLLGGLRALSNFGADLPCAELSDMSAGDSGTQPMFCSRDCTGSSTG